MFPNSLSCGWETQQCQESCAGCINIFCILIPHMAYYTVSSKVFFIRSMNKCFCIILSILLCWVVWGQKTLMFARDSFEMIACLKECSIGHDLGGYERNATGYGWSKCNERCQSYRTSGWVTIFHPVGAALKVILIVKINFQILHCSELKHDCSIWICDQMTFGLQAWAWLGFLQTLLVPRLLCNASKSWSHAWFKAVMMPYKAA